MKEDLRQKFRSYRGASIININIVCTMSKGYGYMLNEGVNAKYARYGHDIRGTQ